MVSTEPLRARPGGVYANLRITGERRAICSLAVHTNRSKLSPWLRSTRCWSWA